MLHIVCLHLTVATVEICNLSKQSQNASQNSAQLPSSKFIWAAGRRWCWCVSEGKLLSVMCQLVKRWSNHLKRKFDASALTAPWLRDFFLFVPATKRAMSSLFVQRWKAADWRWTLGTCTCSWLVFDMSGNFFYHSRCLWNSLHFTAEFWWTAFCEGKSGLVWLQNLNS